MTFEEIKQRLMSGDNPIDLAAEENIGQNKFRDILKFVGFQFAGKVWSYNGDTEILKHNIQDYRSLSNRELRNKTEKQSSTYSSNPDITASNTNSNIGITTGNTNDESRITNGNTNSNIKDNILNKTNVLKGYTGNTQGNTNSNISITGGNTNDESRITNGNTNGNPFTISQIESLKRLAINTDEILRLLNNEKLSNKSLGKLKEEINQIEGNTIKKTFVVGEKTAKRLDAFAKKTNLRKSDLLTVAIQNLLKQYDN